MRQLGVVDSYYFGAAGRDCSEREGERHGNVGKLTSLSPLPSVENRRPNLHVQGKEGRAEIRFGFVQFEGSF